MCNFTYKTNVNYFIMVDTKQVNNMNNSVSEIARIWQQTLKIIDERLQERQLFDSFFANTYIYDYSGDTVIVVTKNFTSQRLLSTK